MLENSQNWKSIFWPEQREIMSKNISINTIHKPFDFSSIEVKAPFACLLYSSQEDTTDDEMMLVANWLISSGCRYAVCTGLKRSQWHDVIDAADIIHEPSAKILIMTTWHEDEAVEDVIWYWLDLTDFEDITFENYLALLVGSSSAIEEKVLTAFKNNPFFPEMKLI